MADPTASTSLYPAFQTRLIEELKIRVPEVIEYFFMLDPADGAGEIAVRTTVYEFEKGNQRTVMKTLRLRVACAFEAILPSDVDMDNTISQDENEAADAQSTIRIENVGDRIAKTILIVGTQSDLCLEDKIKRVGVMYENKRDPEISGNDPKAWYNVATLEFEIMFQEDLCEC